MAKRPRVPAALHAELTEYSSLLRALRTSDTLDLTSHLIQPPPSFISQASLAGDVSLTDDDDGDGDGFVDEDDGENDGDDGDDNVLGGGNRDSEDDDDGENDEEALDESPTDSLSQDPFAGVASPSYSSGDDSNLKQPVNNRKSKQRDTWTRWPLLAGDVHVPEWGLSDEVKNIAERVLALSALGQGGLVHPEPNLEDAAGTSNLLNPLTEQDDLMVPDDVLHALTADSAAFLARILALVTAHVPAAEKSMQNRITPISWETVVEVACAHGVISPPVADVVRGRMSPLFTPARPDTTHRSRHLLALRQRTSQMLSKHEESILDVPNFIPDARKKPVTPLRTLLRDVSSPRNSSVAELTHCSQPMYRLRKRPGNGSEREQGPPSIWDSSEAWAACAKALREYDEAMIQDWKEEIDTLLVFAGLFSAVLTAFNIESYKWLQQQSDDTHTAILSQISMQLNSFTVNANFVNATIPAVPQVAASFKASGFAVRLNTLWFSSLVCSLLSASLGLLVKQWLREYLAGSSNISRESIRIRQYRYDGMRRWRVPEIILCLPILLQAALLLFFIGLLDLLWTLHPIVAGVVTTIVAVSMLFAITTSLLPPLYSDCPYKSPQSWLICAFIQWLKRSAASLAARYHAHLHQPRASAIPTDRERAHGAATPDPFATMLDLPAIIAHSRAGAVLRGWLHRLSMARAYGSWKERERLAMEEGRGAAALDDATLAGADAMFMDDAFLHAVVRPCMRDIAPRAALRCVDTILLRRAPRVLNDLPYWDLAPPGEGGRGDTGTLTLMNLLLDVLHRLNSGRDSDAMMEEWEEDEGPAETQEDARRGVLMTMHRLVRAIPAPSKSKTGSNESHTDAQTRPLFRRMFEVLAAVLDAEAGRASPERFVRERSFNLMCKMFTRFQAVGPDCIAAFCAYSKQTRQENAPYRFVQACYMVIRASAVLARATSRPGSIAEPEQPSTSNTLAPPSPYSAGSGHKRSFDTSFTSSVTLYSEPLRISAPPDSEDPHSDAVEPTSDSDSADDYESIRPALLDVLHDLECFFSMPVSRAAEYRPTMAMLAECAQAVLALAVRDRLAVSLSFVRALSAMVGYASAAEADADVGMDADAGGGWESADGDMDQREELDVHAARQAVRWLRRMYGLRVSSELGHPPGEPRKRCGY
ncbi:hypothetical protein GSI_09112 [Ganoderma sinense ZZ0214-1]|uniref:DUF6535 domain-containing protein n=1 Tax=Ganoderma sinense ZZ0214-1 TaxID=1077348 RepID=A0A2G8S5P9_9APHY|nr:hypothetical protein GSI_09112 [Ganoderma sinense ZZ0214-1]